MTTTAPPEQIATLIETTTSTFTPLHNSIDQAKVDRLIADMLKHGWRGAPLVTEGGSGGNAYTGSHRIDAAARCWNEHWENIEIPHIDIADLCAIYGIDWAAMVNDHNGDTYQAAADLRFTLPREVVDYLGFDVDGAL